MKIRGEREQDFVVQREIVESKLSSTVSASSDDRCSRDERNRQDHHHHHHRRRREEERRRDESPKLPRNAERRRSSNFGVERSISREENEIVGAAVILREMSSVPPVEDRIVSKRSRRDSESRTTRNAENLKNNDTEGNDDRKRSVISYVVDDNYRLQNSIVEKSRDISDGDKYSALVEFVRRSMNRKAAIDRSSISTEQQPSSSSTMVATMSRKKEQRSNVTKESIVAVVEKPRNFHELSLILCTYSRIAKKTRDTLKLNVREIFDDACLRICVGAFKKKNPKELFQFFTYQIGNPQNIKNRVKTTYKFHNVNVNDNFLSDKYMMSIPELWYPFNDDAHCFWNGSDDLDDTLRSWSYDHVNGEICQRCMTFFVAANKHGACQDLYKTELIEIKRWRANDEPTSLGSTVSSDKLRSAERSSDDTSRTADEVLHSDRKRIKLERRNVDVENNFRRSNDRFEDTVEETTIRGNDDVDEKIGGGTIESTERANSKAIDESGIVSRFESRDYNAAAETEEIVDRDARWNEILTFFSDKKQIEERNPMTREETTLESNDDRISNLVDDSNENVAVANAANVNRYDFEMPRLDEDSISSFDDEDNYDADE